MCEFFLLITRNYRIWNSEIKIRVIIKNKRLNFVNEAIYFVCNSFGVSWYTLYYSIVFQLKNVNDESDSLIRHRYDLGTQGRIQTRVRERSFL